MTAAVLLVMAAVSCAAPRRDTNVMVRTAGGIEFVRVDGGGFMMGDERCGLSTIEECPRRRVAVTGFWMSRTEITRSQYREVTGRECGRREEGDGSLPAANVNWHDAMAFCRIFSARAGVNARLPYEAEWEYACRAGSDTPYYWGDAPDGRYGWYFHNSRNRTARRSPRPAGVKLPNRLGLYDMSGNLWEWCMDWYDTYYYRRGESHDPKGPAKGELKSLRGGCWNDGGYYMRSSVRNAGDPAIGDEFRGFRIIIPDGGPPRGAR